MAKGSNGSTAAAARTGEAGEEKVNGGTPPATGSPASKFARPVGYQKSASNVDQFWSQEGPIHGKVRGCKAYANKLTGRSNKIYVFELVEECQTETSKGEKFEMLAKKGELVGVWGSPGMRELDSLQDCIVWMVPNGTKDVGKPQPMKVYDIVYKGAGKPIVHIGPVDVGDAGSRANEAAGESDALPF